MLTASAFGSYRPVLGIVSVTLLLAALGMRWAVQPAAAMPANHLLGRAVGRSG